MKFTKMSLVAALLIGSSAFAIDNIKVSGDAKLFYQTTDGVSGAQAIKNATNGTNDTGSLFSKDSSSADAALNLNVTADLAKNNIVAISAGAGYTVLSTLGLENNLVSNVWGGAHTAVTGTGSTYGQVLGGAKVENANWMNEAWIAATTGKTTAKIGRMELDTPLAFTETWSIEKNTFEAAVVINQDVPDTTLVGAYIGNGNGTEVFGQNAQSNVQTLGLASAAVVNGEGTFTTYGTNGAYAVGVINNSFKPLTAQAWYYSVTRVADAYWLQADLDTTDLGIEGLTLGAQYSSVKSVANGATADTVYALQVGYAMKDLFAASLSYSSVNNDGSIGYAGFNTATNMTTAQTKLYTEVWWNYGQVTMSDTDSIHLTVTSPVQGLFDLGVYYTDVNHKATGSQDLKELTVTAGKSFGPLDATLVFINTDAATNDNIVQAYLTLNF
ncbi:hypothetical protein [Sulfurimonas hydrogeniphila]|uniref:hypothetical protein n=2 Tax=Pseudomonadati TaxID=3379134 RepID=UPI00125F6D45|nr:hypothetical protein [Sulfurimonas hydrogeniphila]